MRLLLLLGLTAVASADPSWPATGTELELTWVIGHDTAGGVHKAKVGLEAKIGTVVVTTQLGEAYGGLSPRDQPLCRDETKKAGGPPPISLAYKEVAKLVFGGGVVRGFAVKRDKAGQVSIVSFDHGDDSCGKPSCPPKPITTIAIPTRVTRFTEHMVLVDKAGKRTPFACKVD